MLTLTLVATLLSATLALPSPHGTQVLPEQPDSQIINGNLATLGQFPHQAWLIMKYGLLLSGGCGGSLIHPKWILTAAHCTDGAQSIEVILGAIDKTDESVPSYVSVNSLNIITHEAYDPDSSYANDIALIELSEEVELNEYVQTVKLATEKPVAYQDVTSSGFGSTIGIGEVSSDVMYWVTNPVLNREDNKCFMVFDDPTKICIDSSGPKGVCSGDSGGPLNSLEDMGGDDGIVYGVASYVINGCQSGPHVFTNVASFIDWIEVNTGLILH